MTSASCKAQGILEPVIIEHCAIYKFLNNFVFSFGVIVIYAPVGQGFSIRQVGKQGLQKQFVDLGFFLKTRTVFSLPLHYSTLRPKPLRK